MRFHRPRIREHKVEILVAAVFILVFILANHWAKQRSPNRDDAKLKELRQLAVETPVFPTFSDDGTAHESSRAMDAGVYKAYFSSAVYDDVKLFYTRELGHLGWKLTSEEPGRRLDFQKGGFSITIEYGGADINSWNYGVSFKWHNQQS